MTALMRDRDTQRVYRRYNFSKAQLIRPGVAYCVAGKVNSADELYLVIESVRLDTKGSGFARLLFLLMARSAQPCVEWRIFLVLGLERPAMPMRAGHRGSVFNA